MNTKLSKLDESQLPKFNDHNEASNYFKLKYGEDFFFSNIFKFEGDNLHVYVLILDREKYNESQIYLMKNRTIFFPVSDQTTKGYRESFQKIYIWETGKVMVTV